MTSTMPETTVLVVDANPITLLATAGLMDSHGYGCFCARSNAAALRVPGQTRLDAVVIDIGDDAEGALELCQELRRVSGSEELPVVLLAEPRWSGLQQRCERMRATRCLFKPIDPNVLLDLVQQSLWVPHLMAGHRQRGTRPTRPGWIHL